MIGDLAAALVFLVAGPLALGALLAIVVDAALQLRAIRRTGHVLDCPGLGGWTCDCRDSEPAPGGSRRGRAAAARVFVLPDAGPPAVRDRARLPGLRPAGRAAPPSSPRH